MRFWAMAILAMLLGGAVKADGVVTAASGGCNAGSWSFAGANGPITTDITQNASTFSCSPGITPTSPADPEILLSGPPQFGSANNVTIMFPFIFYPQGNPAQFTASGPVTLSGDITGCDAAGCGVYSFAVNDDFLATYVLSNGGEYLLQSLSVQDPPANTPEPNPLTLLAIGLCGMLGWSRYRMEKGRPS